MIVKYYLINYIIKFTYTQLYIIFSHQNIEISYIVGDVLFNQ